MQQQNASFVSVYDDAIQGYCYTLCVINVRHFSEPREIVKAWLFEFSWPQCTRIFTKKIGYISHKRGHQRCQHQSWSGTSRSKLTESLIRHIPLLPLPMCGIPSDPQLMAYISCQQPFADNVARGRPRLGLPNLYPHSYR